MSTRQTYSVQVIVFRGRPDCQWNRHVGIWFLPIDGGSHYYFHARGVTGYYELADREDWDPTDSVTFASSLTVADTRRQISAEELRHLMASVPFSSGDSDFNCQTWVAYALNVLYQCGYLTEEEYMYGVDGMFEITLQATEEG